MPLRVFRENIKKNKRMKELLLIIAIFFISNTLFSQEVSICEAFDLLVKAAPTKFDIYKGANVDNLKSTFNATLKIKGAVKSTIDQTLYSRFETDFGTYETSEQANIVMIGLKNEVIKCNPGFEFVFARENLGILFNYVFVYKNSTGAIVYNAYLKKRKINDKFNVSFCMNVDNLIRNFAYLTNELQNITQCNDMRKIIEARKTNFDELKGELKNNGYVDYYPSKFCFPGFNTCVIYPAAKRNIAGSVENLSRFSVSLIANTTIKEAKTTMINVANVVGATLGKGYAVSGLEGGTKISFCLNEDIGQESKEFVVIKVTSTLSLDFTSNRSCFLEVYSPN
jgi:hypothetical protein